MRINMTKIERLVEKTRQYKMLDDRLLVYPLKLRTYEDVTTTVDLDGPENKGKNPMIDELQTTKKVVNVNYKYQLAVVINKSENVKDLEIGDTVIYKVSNLMDFDLIKGVSMLRRFEVYGVVKK